MTILLTRDSVAMGDDIHAPHTHSFTVPGGTMLAEILRLVVAQGYLAAIAGGKATWVAELYQKPVAVLAQQWQQPVMLSNQQPASDNQMVELHFRYYTQQNPDEVLASLRRTRP